MVKTLREEYGAHLWMEHVPFRPNGKKWGQIARHGLATVYNIEYNSEREDSGGGGIPEYFYELLESTNCAVDGGGYAGATAAVGKKWELRRAVEVCGVRMADKKLSYEGDQPKVLFWRGRQGYWEIRIFTSQD